MGEKIVARSPQTLGLRNENLTWYVVPLVRLLCPMWLLQSISSNVPEIPYEARP